MKSIPIGVQSFTKVRDLDLYYVDKTELIDSILNDTGTKVFLFTRPRRFGKSLNLSMLDAYLNIRYKGNKWFDGLSKSDIVEYSLSLFLDFRRQFPLKQPRSVEGGLE